MERIPRGTLVRRSNTQLVGVAVNDPWGCCSPEETPVVYEGATGFLGTVTAQLEVLGQEKAVACFDKCGAGRGEECCIFLVVGPNGPECERFGQLRNSLIFRDMVAKRHPAELFPACQPGENHA